MKIRIGLVVLLALVLGCIVRPAAAGPNANAKIILHARAASNRANNFCTDPASSPAGCSTINTNGRVIPYNVNAPGQVVYLLAADAAGVRSLDCGIQFTGAEPSAYSWTTCADADTTTNSWSSGTGNLITWDTCQSGAIVCAGYFYVTAYAPCQLRVIPDPINNLATVTACDTTMVDTISGHDVSHLGFVSFSVGATTPGYNPCGLITPVTTTTWGGLKAIYAH